MQWGAKCKMGNSMFVFLPRAKEENEHQSPRSRGDLFEQIDILLTAVNTHCKRTRHYESFSPAAKPAGLAVAAVISFCSSIFFYQQTWTFLIFSEVLKVLKRRTKLPKQSKHGSICSFGPRFQI